MRAQRITPLSNLFQIALHRVSDSDFIFELKQSCSLVHYAFLLRCFSCTFQKAFVVGTNLLQAYSSVLLSRASSRAIVSVFFFQHLVRLHQLSRCFAMSSSLSRVYQTVLSIPSPLHPKLDFSCSNSLQLRFFLFKQRPAVLQFLLTFSHLQVLQSVR